MSKKETYYVGRVLKSGVNFTQEKLINAFLNAQPTTNRKYNWSFIDVKEKKVNKEHYIYGKLAQYLPENEIDVIETKTRSLKKDHTRNQIQSAAKFVYLPNHSGIAFQNIWNSITSSVFKSNFSDIINTYYENLFTNAEIELITDYSKFASSIKKLDSILEIKANVHIPNPLFGNLWEDLNNELRRRNAEKMSVSENAKTKQGLKSELINTVAEIAENKSTKVNTKLSISESAILMAADGYGKGILKGYSGKELVEIKTNTMELTFKIDSSDNFDELIEKATEVFKDIKLERNMEHGK